MKTKHSLTPRLFFGGMHQNNQHEACRSTSVRCHNRRSAICIGVSVCLLCILKIYWTERDDCIKISCDRVRSSFLHNSPCDHLAHPEHSVYDSLLHFIFLYFFFFFFLQKGLCCYQWSTLSARAFVFLRLVIPLKSLYFSSYLWHKQVHK